ncbi:MAG: hypothetical protein ACLVCH_11840 [Roseburia inulinivorans]
MQRDRVTDCKVASVIGDGALTGAAWRLESSE